MKAITGFEGLIITLKLHGFSSVISLSRLLRAGIQFLL